MDLSEVSEGKSRLFVPLEEHLTKKNTVFYNPHMELNRDLSVAVASIIKPESFCDALSGSGARAVRIANEAQVQVTANDLNSSAVELIRKNAALNDVELNVSNMDANRLLSESSFDFIDLDPFGPPVRFIDSALRSIKNRGVLAVTATDTSALCGTYPAACRRKYDSVSLRTDYYNEAGLRILIGYVARAALKYGLCAEPLFSHSTRHYFRTYLRVRRSSSGAKKTLSQITYLRHCFKCMGREYVDIEGLGGSCQCGADMRHAGPLWSGMYADPEFCSHISKTLSDGEYGRKKEALKIAGLVEKEQDVKLPYYNIHKAYKRLSQPVKPMEEIIAGFQGAGFYALRTHFSDLGLRSDAGIDDIYSLLQ